jgi:hypothetical protein
MHRLLLALVAVLVWLGPARPAMLERGDFPEGFQTALAFDLSDDKKVRAEVLALPGGAAELSVLELPFSAKNLVSDGRHVVFAWTRSNRTLLSYNLRPAQSSSLQLIGFEPSYGEGSLNAFLEGSNTPDPETNLYFVRDGLQRVFFLRMPPSQKVALEGTGSREMDVRTPQLIAVRLPPKYEGRVLPGRTGMFDPEPFKATPVALFKAESPNATQTFRVRYNLPSPSWAAPTTRILLKAIALLIPILLLGFTSPDEINRSRYKYLAIALGIVALGIYGFLIFMTWKTEGDIEAIYEDMLFAVMNIVVAGATYWVKTKPSGEAPPDAPKAAMI